MRNPQYDSRMMRVIELRKIDSVREPKQGSQEDWKNLESILTEDLALMRNGTAPFIATRKTEHMGASTD